eukprot:CAMPEP_0113482726 /NCGR_PEP_ID=MMETSP0014_2-20120614/23070_1 /TAXON_ID=2857 /ORGANISM="Nitzschia sp." /LENGTH=191 /DNA_ID=CAMNT_0000376257 /DNA_START=107 /DNA_END=682 /DNA_ORIENTATION=+ /assembly_acc=CAM_ASM_000159
MLSLVSSRIGLAASRVAASAVSVSAVSSSRAVFVGAAASATRTTNTYSNNFSTATELVPGKGFAKTSTGIVGLPADPDALNKIVEKYQALLDRMAASDLPETAQYRVDVTKIANYRISVAQEHSDDPDMVEELCQCGQVEELVQQADDEMTVLDMYLKERLWELVDADVDVEIDYNSDPSKDGDEVEDDDV